MLSAIKTSLMDVVKMGDEMSDEMSDVNENKYMQRWKQIETYLEQHEYIMNADVRALCGVSSSTANRILSALVKEKKLTRYKIGRHWGYKK